MIYYHIMLFDRTSISKAMIHEIMSAVCNLERSAPSKLVHSAWKINYFWSFRILAQICGHFCVTAFHVTFRRIEGVFGGGREEKEQ
jgi:hypothetical protein